MVTTNEILSQVVIVFQDDDILIVNKPAGLLTISDGYDPAQPYLKKYLEGKFGPVWVVHRLDKLTAGLIVFARNPKTHRYLSIQFEKRLVSKKYSCYVVGTPDWQNRTIVSPLKVNADKKHRTLVDFANGKPAKTSFLIVNRLSWVTLVEAVPFTGYTHQIRSHLYSIGFPIYGDALYGFKEVRYQNILPEKMRSGYGGFLMLCAHQITLSFPNDHQSRVFSIDLPQHFLDFDNTIIKKILLEND